MSIQTAKVPEVIFAGNQFFQPFSHSPEWLEELIERGDIWKDEYRLWNCYSYGIEHAGQIRLQAGDKIKLTGYKNNRPQFEVIRDE